MCDGDHPGVGTAPNELCYRLRNQISERRSRFATWTDISASLAWFEKFHFCLEEGELFARNLGIFHPESITIDAESVYQKTTGHLEQTDGYLTRKPLLGKLEDRRLDRERVTIPRLEIGRKLSGTEAVDRI